MALIGFEGFDYLPANPTVALSQLPQWTAGSTFSNTAAGQFGGKCIQVSTQSASNAYVHFMPGGNYQTMYVGFRFAFSALQGADGSFLYIWDNGVAQGTLGFNAAGKLRLWRGNRTFLLGTGSTTLIPNAWYYVEMRYTVDNTNGYFEVRLNGTTEMSGGPVDTQDTANAYWQYIQLGGTTGSNPHSYDDFYCNDETGPAPMNGFLGPIRVETLFPTANDSVQWTPNASTNVSRIQDAATDDDTTYNASSTAGHIDLFTHGALSSTPSDIYAVDVVTRIKKDDTTNRTCRSKMVSGATTANGATVNVPTAYLFLRDRQLVDPNTGAGWTASAVNATKIGYEVVT